MALLRNALYFAGVLLPLALADVDFTEPAAGDVITGTSLVATWLESGQKPSISTFDSYSLFLCAGGNNESDFINLFNLQPYATYGEGNKWTGAISTGWGGNSTDAYFLLMVSTSACGGTIKNFSKRFTISSMTGSFPLNVVQGIQTIGSDSSGPATDQSDAGPALACTASVAAEPAPSTATNSAFTVAIGSSAAATSSVTATSTPSINPLASSRSITLSTGALAGIIITSMLIFATLCGVAAFVFLRLRKRRTQPQPPTSPFKPWKKRKEMERLDSTEQLAELSATARRKELDADKRHPTELATIVRAELPARRSIYELPGS